MFRKKSPPVTKPLDAAEHAIMATIDRTQAVIHFKPDGTILAANDNFLAVMGYTLDEIVGQHHSMFVDEAFAASEEYAEFWRKLRAGEFTTSQFARLTKDGSVVWINATYAAVLDAHGNVESVVKMATDITHRRETLAMIGQGLKELRQGNLMLRLEPQSVDDLDELIRHLNDAVEQIAAVMRVTASASDKANATIAKLNTSSEDLSSRTTSQAATLEQTAAALEEVTSAAQSSAVSAKEAEELARNTRSKAQSSTEVVEKSITAMAEIKQSSEEISSIISVIDDIAFQTNLLALNAGVEAARAGDSGRGFAVVAAEVRALAHRSQEAAGEIKNLISTSANHVSRGVDLVNGTGEELTKIIDSISSMATKMSDIAVSADEQSQAIGEVNNGVRHLDHVTQQNAGMVGDITQANSSLTRDVQSISNQVGKFSFDDTRSGKPDIRKDDPPQKAVA